MRDQVLYRQPALRRTLVAVALAAACSSSWALPTLTLNPAAVGLAGSAFTGDNILTSDFSGVTFTDATHFVDNGFLQVTSLQLSGSTFTPTGLNSTYGLWFRFQATGHLTTGNASTILTAPVSGAFDTLTYTLSGNNGTQTFGATPAGGICVSGCAGATTLASGSVIGGGVGSTMMTDPNTMATVFVPNAAATVSFAAASVGVLRGAESVLHRCSDVVHEHDLGNHDQRRRVHDHPGRGFDQLRLAGPRARHLCADAGCVERIRFPCASAPVLLNSAC